MTLRRRCALLTGVSALVLASSATAQTADAPAPTPYAAQQQTSVDDIIVTAQRRSESAARTPVAVAVLSAEVLAQAAVTTESDLQIATPGLQVRAGSSSNAINYAVRGQSLDAYSSGRPGVVPYFNEVQVGGSGTSALYDLQSVQVLKGPQGTLFGRNATGGAVLFQSQRPEDEFGGYFSVAAGNFNALKVEGALNAATEDGTLLGRVAGFYNERDGYQVNLFNGGRLGNVDRWGIRGSLTWRPTETFENRLVVDYADVGGNNTVGVLRSFDPTGAFPTTSLYSNATFPAGATPSTGPYVSDFVLSQLLLGFGLTPAQADAVATGNYARYIAGRRGVDPAGVLSYLSTQNARGPYIVSSDASNEYAAENLIITNSTSFDLGPDTQIRNIFGYTNLQSYPNIDVDGSPYGILYASGEDLLTEQLSNELQLVGKTFEGRLSYVTGIYYSDESTTDRRPTTNFDLIMGGLAQVNSHVRENKTIAAYGQGTYDLSDATGVSGLGITAGLRYTSEEISNRLRPDDVSYGLATTGIPAAGIPASAFDNDQSKTIRNVSYTLGIQRQVNPSLLLFASTRKSFRNGGYNADLAPRIGGAEVGGNSYDTEELIDAEIGFKFQGVLGDMPTRLNVSAFHDWIENNQRTAFTLVSGALAAVTVNVPKATVYGFEVDGSISPTDWLRLGGTVNYTSAEFDSGHNQVTVLGNTITYLHYTDTPEWTGVLFGDLTFPVSTNFTLNLHADVYTQTETQTSSATNVPLDGYTLANFRVGLDNDAQGWSLTANLKNAFDETYYVGGLPLGSLVQFNTAIPGDRRTFLAELRFRF